MLTQKQQTLIIIALSNVAMMSSQTSTGRMPNLEERKRFMEALDQVRMTAQILTDTEMIPLALEAMESILALPVDDVKITPDPSEVPLQ